MAEQSESIQNLDNDALIQSEQAVHSCLQFLRGDDSLFNVMVEAVMEYENLHREILRRAKLGKTITPKRVSA